MAFIKVPSVSYAQFLAVKSIQITKRKEFLGADLIVRARTNNLLRLQIHLYWQKTEIIAASLNHSHENLKTDKHRLSKVFDNNVHVNFPLLSSGNMSIDEIKSKMNIQFFPLHLQR